VQVGHSIQFGIDGGPSPKGKEREPSADSGQRPQYPNGTLMAPHFRSGIRKIWTKWVIFPIRGFKGDAKAAEPNFVRSRSGRITGYRALDGVSFDLRAATGWPLIGANGAASRAC
jgi:hypothetical protein